MKISRNTQPVSWSRYIIQASHQESNFIDKLNLILWDEATQGYFFQLKWELCWPSVFSASPRLWRRWHLTITLEPCWSIILLIVINSKRLPRWNTTEQCNDSVECLLRWKILTEGAGRECWEIFGFHGGGGGLFDWHHCEYFSSIYYYNLPQFSTIDVDEGIDMMTSLFMCSLSME